MKRVLLLICCGLLLTSESLHASDFRFSSQPNKAHLIQWRAWGHDALEEAKKQDRLILLSLSAVWCHWCHVMDETTYSNEDIIAFINDHFIAVRVDSDMRPDIDALYNQGGWPTTVIMTPQGEVLTGGTYLQPDEMLGRLQRTADIYQNDRSSITGWLEETRTARGLRDLPAGEAASNPGENDLETIVGTIAETFDEQYGGFGTGQKFPNPETTDFLLARYVQKKDSAIKRIVTRTLDHMARGRIFDNVAGGFFRYATKPDWSEPHYEKMLDVNAGMIRNYAEASLVFGNSEYRQIVQKCVRYIRKNLYDAASGAFFGSQDADEAYYKSRVRSTRRLPAIDKTAYADSSAQMISALVSAYGAVGDPQYLDMAMKGSDYLLATVLTKDAGVFHYSLNGARQLDGLLSDNVLVGLAMLDLYSVTGEKRYLNTAKEIERLITSKFYNVHAKRFRFSLAAPSAPGVLSTVNDNLANYRAIRFMGRLLALEEFQDKKKIRNEALAAFSGTYQDFTPNAAAYGSALLWATGDPVRITVVAKGKMVKTYLAAIRGVSLPKKTVSVLLIAEDDDVINKRGYPNQNAVYLCVGKQCSKPITDPGKLKEELKRFLGQQGRK